MTSFANNRESVFARDVSIVPHPKGLTWLEPAIKEYRFPPFQGTIVHQWSEEKGQMREDGQKTLRTRFNTHLVQNS